ncbi:MAG: hypothetical protein FWG66_11035 [Spirochaetes bacterium]|nr:hypothetical protein [Spirochaetota bacterium]
MFEIENKGGYSTADFAKYNEQSQKTMSPLVPDSVKQYAKRLGKAGLDYRCIRVMRTEQAAMLADEQITLAMDSDICTGELDWVMTQGRDAWSCNCEKYSKKSPWKVDDPERPEIPLHPNCTCQWYPRLKTDEEILADAEGEDWLDDDELDALIDGDEELKALFDAIDGESGGGAPPDKPPSDDSGDSGGDDIEGRFGKEFARFYDKSMGYIDANKPIPDNVRRELESYLANSGKTVDGFIAEVNDFVKNGEIVHHDDLDSFLRNIDDFENDPRVKSQFETGDSNVLVAPEDRNHWERRLIGEAESYGAVSSQRDRTGYGIENAHRPVYAVVTNPNELQLQLNDGGSRKIAFIFSGNARDRASFTLGNSSIDGMGSFRNDAASIFSKPQVNASKNARSFFNSYVEAQVWGGIDLRRNDVRAVVIDESLYQARASDSGFLRFLRVLEANGVSVERVPSGKNQLTNRSKNAIIKYKGESNMRLLATGDGRVYDAGDNWYHVRMNPDGSKQEIYKSKAESPWYPIARCIKWGMKPVDIGYLNALSPSKGGSVEAAEEYARNNPPIELPPLVLPQA